ncbi:MAG TPA: Lon-insertion domain-containing protein, partial [Candidatus Nitrosotenuis sp.]|nr:Lon-insertion domain-containing protein [Candidatus Nitrosotenuis sp.]
EEIPLELKVVLIGTPQAYDRFSHDEEFARLFSVLCDFDEEMPRTPETERLYARLVASLGTPPFEAGAVARLVEFGAREVEDRHKLSAILGDVTRLAQEAALEAGRQGAARVARGHVEEALRARRRRASLHEEKLMEAVLTGTVRIDTEGRAVGQVNSISVVDMPDYSFGRPGRVTARVSLGKEGIVDIEREAQNAGEMHSKGVLILGGFLAGRYAERAPLSVSISLCFEQLYEQVDGDSASSTELYAILSAIARVPMRQGIAVTGAVDQMGNVQPVGGVNEKIEGFFDLCYRRGLTGEQGVLLPRGNLRNLMLKEELVRAVAAGLFHLWAIGHIDEGLEILSDLPAGRRGRRGRYPRGTFNYLVQRNLERMAGDLRLFQHWEPPE